MSEELLMIPGPVPVLPRIRNAMSKPMIYHRGDEFREMYVEIVSALKWIFQTRNDLFVLSGSGTCAMEAAIGNLVRKDTPIVSIANGKFGERLVEIGRRYSDNVTAVNFEWGSSIELEEVKAAMEEKHPQVVTMVHNETSTGILNPAEAIARLTRKYNALLVLDCITSIGGYEVPVDDWGVDIAIVGSQKCLGAPPGLSAISVSERAWKMMLNNNDGGDNSERPYYMDLIAYKDSFDKGQTPYTPALPLFFALHEALELIKEEGMVKRVERHRRLANTLRSAVTDMGLSLFPRLNDLSAYSNTVTAIKVPEELDDARLRGGMRERGVMIAGGQGKLKGKIFRIATMGNIREGEAGERGGPPGDLYLVIHVREHEIFRREGEDLYCDVPVRFAQAALGDEIWVKNIYGDEVRLKIPPGTQSGTIFRLRNQGMPDLKGHGRGNMMVRIKVVTPKKLSKRQKELLIEFDKEEEKQSKRGTYSTSTFWKRRRKIN